MFSSLQTPLQGGLKGRGSTEGEKYYCGRKWKGGVGRARWLRIWPLPFQRWSKGWFDGRGHLWSQSAHNVWGSGTAPHDEGRG